MAFRFFRRVKLAPGLGLNLATRGASVSVGPRGFKLTFSPRGVRATVGIPGTGVSYSMYPFAKGKAPRANEASPATSVPPPPPRSTPRVAQEPAQTAITADVNQQEELIETSAPDPFEPAPLTSLAAAFADYRAGHRESAIRALEKLGNDAAAHFGLAAIFFERAAYDMALQRANAALNLIEQDGTVVDERLNIPLALTEELTLDVPPTREGIVVLIAEIHENMHKPAAAIAVLRKGIAAGCDDVFVRLALAELLHDTSAAEQDMREILALARRVEPTDFAAITLLLYKARALARLGEHASAQQLLRQLVESSDELPDELKCALRAELDEMRQPCAGHGNNANKPRKMK